MIFDLEADGLKATKIHVLAYEEDGEVKHTFSYNKMREVLLKQKVLIGHNIIRYDIPTIERILKIKIKARLIDTLALSWYIFPDRVIHGLDSFGKEFGIPKPKIDNWDNLSPEEYANRCVEDVKINSKLWGKILAKLNYIYNDNPEDKNRLIKYLSFKMDCAREQERSRCRLDVDRAKSNLEQLTHLVEDKVEQLKGVMPQVETVVKKTKPKKPFKKDGTYSATGANWFSLLKEHNLPKDYEGEVEVIVGLKEPNPGSPQQLKDWLLSLGWEPETFKYVRDKESYDERKIPQIRVDVDGVKELCPSVLKLVEQEPAIHLLSDLGVLQHRESIFKGFLENQEDGWIKAEIAGLTNTLRFKHKILVNLPGVDKPWGKEIRGCLIADDGQVFCGSDMSSLEENTKKHYMWDYDPEFVLEMSKPGFDAHLDLAKFAKVVTQDEIDAYVSKVEGAKNLKPIRSNYKVTNYSATYGVKPKKLSITTGLPLSEAAALLDSFWQRNWSLVEIAKNTKVIRYGDEMWLFNPVSKLYYSLRYEKDIFSTLNQGTGVFCFDSWVAEIRKVRPQLTAQFHDEIVLSIKEGAEEKCRKLLKSCIQKVNNKLKLNVQLDVDVQFGKTYADIH